MIGWVHWLMFLLFAGWGVYLIIAIYKFNSKRNPNADYVGVKSHYSQYAEYGVIVFEAFLLIGLSIPLYAQLKTDLPKNNELLHIRVIAPQFAWNIHYPGPDGKFGESNIDLVAIGIGHDVSRYYKKAIKISDVQELGDVMITQLSSLFKNKKKLH